MLINTNLKTICITSQSFVSDRPPAKKGGGAPQAFANSSLDKKNLQVLWKPKGIRRIKLWNAKLGQSFKTIITVLQAKLQLYMSIIPSMPRSPKRNVPTERVGSNSNTWLQGSYHHHQHNYLLCFITG